MVFRTLSHLQEMPKWSENKQKSSVSFGINMPWTDVKSSSHLHSVLVYEQVGQKKVVYYLTGYAICLSSFIIFPFTLICRILRLLSLFRSQNYSLKCASFLLIVLKEMFKLITTLSGVMSFKWVMSIQQNQNMSMWAFHSFTTTVGARGNGYCIV